MIKSITFENFYSFAEETTVDFSLGKKPTPSSYDIHVDEERYNKAIAVIGPNGAGKTQLLKPLAFLSWFISDSYLNSSPDEEVPYAHHVLHSDKPTKFELDFMMAGQDYRYQLTVTRQGVEYEALFTKTSSKFSYVFKREIIDKGYRFSQKGFPLLKSKAEKIRSNTSIIGAAYNHDVEEARPFIDFFERIETNVVSSGRRHFQHRAILEAAETFHEFSEYREKMSLAISQFDLGIKSVDVRLGVVRDEAGKEKQIYVPFGKHQTDDGIEFELPFFEESSGTQSAFVLLEPIIKTLQNGGIAVIDELDNDLHPHLVPVLIDWFRFEHTNPKQAQLIFTCHSPEVLDRLQKHQVYLVEKVDQVSEAWRLDEMQNIRSDDNLYAKYMVGALGAVPDL